jgi:hypothetical protein
LERISRARTFFSFDATIGLGRIGVGQNAHLHQMTPRTE